MSKRAGFPLAAPGQTIGLLGGSFDPPHAGHVHITKVALARFGLDRMWWLVSPANPLKGDGPAPMAQRLAAARETMDHPRVEITDIEARLGTRYTVQTLRALRRRYPGIRFVWLMGADNLATIHHWDSWQEIFRLVPVGVLARPGQGPRARWSAAARRFAGARLRPAEAQALPRADPPAWCYLPLPMRDISSTAIRARGEWPR